MPYLAMRKKSVATTKPWFNRHLYDIQPGNGVSLFWDTKHIHTYLITFPGPTRGRREEGWECKGRAEKRAKGRERELPSVPQF